MARQPQARGEPSAPSPPPTRPPAQTLNALPPDEQDAYNANRLGELILGPGGPSGDPNANPSGGFSYLDNIAQLLSGRAVGGNSNFGAVLLDQLLGNPVPEGGTFNLRMTPQPDPQISSAPYALPSQNRMPYVPSHASDIPGELGPYDMGRVGKLDLQTNPDTVGGSAGGQMRHQLMIELMQRLHGGRT